MHARQLAIRHGWEATSASRLPCSACAHLLLPRQPLCVLVVQGCAAATRVLCCCHVVCGLAPADQADGHGGAQLVTGQITAAAQQGVCSG